MTNARLQKVRLFWQKYTYRESGKLLSVPGAKEAEKDQEQADAHPDGGSQ